MLIALGMLMASCNHLSGPETRGPWKLMASGTEENLNGVWGFESGDVYAVGDNGTILHYNGVVWNQIESNTTADLIAVWGGDPNHVFVTGDDGTILYYDGSTWSHMESGTAMPIGRIWGIPLLYANPGQIPLFAYAVGGGPAGTILHFDGFQWRPIDTGATEELIDIIGWLAPPWDGGSGYPSLMVVGENGAARFFDGQDWMETSTGVDEDLIAVFGEYPDNVYGVGRDGTVIQNTKRFLETGPPASWREIGYLSGASLADIAARRYNDMFLVGANGKIVNFDRQEFTEMPSQETASLRAVWSASRRVYAVGEQGTILRYSRAPRPRECPLNVRMTISPGIAPVISWSPNCPVSKVVVEDDWGTVRWFVETDGNLIKPGVVYGTVPPGASERRPTHVSLMPEHLYRVTLIRRDWDKEMIVGSWNLIPQAAGSGEPVVLSPSRKTEMQLATDPAARFFYFQRLRFTGTGAEIYTFDDPVEIWDASWRMIGDPAEREDELNIRPVTVEFLDRDPETGETRLYVVRNLRAADLPVRWYGETATVVWDVLDSD
jgi:hypothetical protein